MGRLELVGVFILDTGMAEEFLELQRLRHGGPADDLIQSLDQASIEYRTSSTSPTFDLTSLGAERDAEVIFSVKASDYPRAREVLEQSYLGAALPADHHLLTASDDDLIEILAHENEWSAFDVAHARRLAEERGIDLARVEREREQSLRLKQEGKQASPFLTMGGMLCCILAGCGFLLFGIAGLGIGWSLVSMKDKTPEGVFPTYDERSRKSGVIMIWFAIVASVVGLGTRLLMLRW